MASRPLNLEGFVENPNYQDLVNIRKADWVAVANYYDIPITTSMRKEKLKNVVVEALIDGGLLHEKAIQALTPAGLPLQQDNPDAVFSTTQTEGIALEFDQEKLFELEKIKLQAEVQFRQQQ